VNKEVHMNKFHFGTGLMKRPHVDVKEACPFHEGKILQMPTHEEALDQAVRPKRQRRSLSQRKAAENLMDKVLGNISKTSREVKRAVHALRHENFHAEAETEE
jgi:hypothetical protein